MTNFYLVLSVLLVAIISIGATEEPKYTEVIDGHTVKCYRNGQLLAHPTDKHRFLFCDDGKYAPDKKWRIIGFGCPVGKWVWNQTKEKCVPEVETFAATQTTEEPKYTEVIDGHVVKCYRNGEVVAHPTDKRSFILCDDGKFAPVKGWRTIIFHCPVGKWVWDETKHNCVPEVDSTKATVKAA